MTQESKQKQFQVRKSYKTRALEILKKISICFAFIYLYLVLLNLTSSPQLTFPDLPWPNLI